MKRLTIGAVSLLVGDDLADAVVEYAVALMSIASADAVTLTGFSENGGETEATFVLSPGVTVVAERNHSELSTPADSGALARLREAIEHL